MVSKPDFDPNTICSRTGIQLVNDETNSSLLNRATMGQYPPGSTFKIVTALTYLRSSMERLNGFSYDCQGSITKEDHTIQLLWTEPFTDRRIFMQHSRNPVTVHLRRWEHSLAVAALLKKQVKIFCLIRSFR